MVYVWCMYNAFKVHVRFFGVYVDSFVYGANHLLCSDVIDVLDYDIPTTKSLLDTGSMHD